MEKYIEKLDELIAVKKIRGHKITKKECEEYAAAWEGLITNEGGFTEIVEKYFYDGFLFTRAKPFVKWVITSGNPAEELNALFRGTLFDRDKSATFRVLISILAQLLMTEMTDKNLICPVIMRLPEASRNKENKTFVDAHKILLKYLLDELDSAACYPVLTELDLKTAFIRDFVALFDELIGKIEAETITKKQVATIAAIKRWLRLDLSDNKTAEVLGPASRHKMPSMENSNGEQPHAETCVEPENLKDPYEQLAEMLKQAYGMSGHLRANAQKAERRNHEIIAELQHEVTALKTQLESAKQRETAMDGQLSDRNNRIASMSLQIKELERRIESLLADMADKENEIAQRIQMIEALSRDRSKQSDEQMNRIASKLKIEYRDFKDAEKLAMDSDLGENMREQLKNVFSILIKAGITLV